MDKSIRAARDQVAMERILSASTVLAGRFELQLPDMPTTGRDKQVLAMQQREAVADLLERLAEATEPKAKAIKAAKD